MSKLYGLIPQAFPKNKRWAIDQDYSDSLSVSEKEWLAKFNNEYYGGKVKKGDDKALHNTDTLRKDCYNKNNESNRDLYAIKNCSSLIESDSEVEIIVDLLEDDLINTIDSHKNWQTFLEWYEKAK